ncbi:MAG: hypothetical protein EPN36_13935 [Rhodanobacteraceae bacterium]|nr:MAG: hypothetical protein EPN36_13935 [Rhodanobacteraceae bacterium]
MYHMIESSIIHGLIYRLVWGLSRQIGMPATIAVGVLALGLVALAHVIFFKRYRVRRARI